MSFLGRLKVALGGSLSLIRQIYRQTRPSLCACGPLFLVRVLVLKAPSGEARPVPSFFVRDSYTLEMLLKTGQLRVTIRVVKDLRQSRWGSKGLSGMKRPQSSSEAIYSILYHLGLETDCLI